MDEKKAKEIFETHKDILDITQAKSNASLLLGKFLHEMMEGNKYEAISGEGTSFASYLADPEVNIARSTATRYIGIYRKFVVELGIKLEDLYGLDTVKLYKIVRVVNKKNVKSLLADVENLSRSDLSRTIDFPNKNPMTCKHNWKPSKAKCTECGEVKNLR